LRHARALELAREAVALNIIQRELGHTNLGTTSIYLQGIDPGGDHHRGAHAPRADDVRSERLSTRSCLVLSDRVRHVRGGARIHTRR
jgi:integrase